MRFYSTLSKSFRCQRGIALPMALLSLLVLSALTVAFSIMAASEPVLANNQLQVAQARAVAESGIERAVWALNNPSATNGIPNTPGAAYPMGAAAAVAPYDGSVATPVIMNGVQVGVFTVVVTQGAVTNERSIVATGWYPTNTGSGPKVKQKIQVSVLQSLFAGNPPPAALTVRGEIQAGGHSSIDSRSDTSCGPKPGSFSQGITEINGAASIKGAASINGADGNGTGNQAGDAVQYVPDANFDQYTYSNADLDALKVFAKKNHTYYQGAVSFNASNQMPNGVIFVDTVSGLNIDKNGTGTTASSDFGSVDIHGNAPASADGIFHGVLIVAGGLSISGNFQMYGLVYAVNDFSYTGTGTGSIEGGVVSRNIRDTSSTSIDTNTGGNAAIVWNCNYVKNGGGYVPPSFMLKSGTYKEIAG